MTPVSLTRRAALALGLLLVNTGADTALADGLGEPQGRVNLTIAGKVGQPDRGNEAPFDMAMLEALPQHSFTTRTPWYDKPMAVRDKGPLFVVYPFDSKAEWRSSTYHERSIWQLKRMSIE